MSFFRDFFFFCGVGGGGGDVGVGGGRWGWGNTNEGTHMARQLFSAVDENGGPFYDR